MFHHKNVYEIWNKKKLSFIKNIYTGDPKEKALCQIYMFIYFPFISINMKSFVCFRKSAAVNKRCQISELVLPELS